MVKTNIESDLRVKDILKEKGIKMYQLADKMGIAPESLTRALQKNPQYSTLKAIANALNVPMHELFKKKEEPIKMRGIVDVNGEIVHINNIDDVYKLLKLVNHEN